MPASRGNRIAGLLAGLLLSVAMPAGAVRLAQVRVEGVADAEARENIEERVALFRQPADRELREARLSYLLRRAPAQARTALEPFGYYEAQIEADVAREGDLARVTLRVVLGEPVRVGSHDIRVRGEGREDSVLQRLVARFRPRPREVFDHRRYEASKLRIERALAERGYFDAEPIHTRVRVERAARNADFDLLWDSGLRYRYGEVRFSGNHLDEALLRQTVNITPGEYYHQDDLLELQQRLVNLDYFGLVDVHPLPEESEAGRVPIEASLLPGKRSIYSAGLGYGTDSGATLRLGWERRWVNQRGHKLVTELRFGQRFTGFNAQYRIPAFAWAEGWYSFGMGLREEEIGEVDTRIAELVASRTGRWRDYDLSVAMHARREQPREGERAFEYSTLVYPALRAARTEGDDPLYPRRGWFAALELRQGLTALGSDISFTQLIADGKWIRGLGENRRLLLRGQAGRIFGGEFDQMPRSMRFYAGGDRSVRGYGYQRIGPRDAEGKNRGARNVAVASVELEQMFNERWGIAVFADAGDAFDDGQFKAKAGVGAGLRWRSPVGPVRIDLGFGLHDPDRGLQLHISIGPDLP